MTILMKAQFFGGFVICGVILTNKTSFLTTFGMAIPFLTFIFCLCCILVLEIQDGGRK